MTSPRARRGKKSALTATSVADVAAPAVDSEKLETEYDAALAKQEQLKKRLEKIALPTQPRAPGGSKDAKKRGGGGGGGGGGVSKQLQQQEPSNAVLAPHQTPLVEKTDVHWDYIMKEMQWLATDFTAERKRHATSRRKVANGVLTHFKNKESRALAALTQAESKRRRLAARLGRNVQKWWNKMDQIVTYQQKLKYDQERNQAMNRKLVKLVKQTETYTKSLVADSQTRRGKKRPRHGNGDADVTDWNGDDSDDEQIHQLKIEEALSVGQRRRRIHDYARLASLEETNEQDVLYGETTTDDSGSDAPFEIASESSEDDETTMEQAELEEELERRGTNVTNLQSTMTSFVPDPVEIQKLREESAMDINEVLERLRQEPSSLDDDVEREKTSTKRVHFASNVEEQEVPAEEKAKRQSTPSQSLDPGEDADDDGDASDVEDFRDPSESELNQLGNTIPDEEENEEFVDDGRAVDDETTMEEEENLPQEMSTEEEISLLQQESELSVDELRAKYAAIYDKPETIQQTPSSSDNSELVKPVVDDEENEEFFDDGKAVDDETTMEEEENLPQEMSADEEIALLQQENEMSVDELRAKYAAIYPSAATAEQSDDNVVMRQELLNDSSTKREKAAGEGGPYPGHAAETSGGSSGGEDDGEFQPEPGTEVDDETTIEAEERMGRDISYSDELDLLQRENEIPIEQLRAMYAGLETADQKSNAAAGVGGGATEREENTGEKDSKTATLTNNESSSAVSGSVRGARRKRRAVEIEGGHGTGEVDEEDVEFQPGNILEVDDETTIEAEEKLGRDMSYEEELALLERENEMSVDELRAMYSGALQDESRGDEDADNPHPDVEDDADVKSKSASVASPERDAANEPSACLKRQRDEENDKVRSSKRLKERQDRSEEDVGVVALDALELSAERAKNTLATRPFLLTGWVKLREYQQVGLNWLVSMQARRLNGILADEMGLGKTLQTIALIAYLAAYKGIWGPHLIVVPTSVIVNWETEFKRFCPGLKVLCYYGSAKRRKELRSGWTKTNWNHVVITSYQLAVQDAFAFKRKRWYYMVLDEAQNIKNFQSQRWQTLINFNTQRRLLLTGTPLQNSLMELWSLLHFLMPYIFRSRKEFSFWFENPMNDMIEGNTGENASVIGRLHGIIRPFVLRRLKKDVETQMPGKYEHIVKCQLSRRQMLMYEEFMARSSTRKALRKGGNFMGMMNVLMQLRKVCAHPDLFEPRSIVTPFVLDPVDMSFPARVFGMAGPSSFFEETSDFLRIPLWCGSQGEPCLESACRHDDIECEGLSRLEKSIEVPPFREMQPLPEDVSQDLLKLEAELHKARQECISDRTVFLNSVNSWRCRAPSFPIPSRLIDRVRFLRKDGCETFDYLSTPTQFLELRKTQQSRAEECDDLVKKFVFCVPKAGLNPSSPGSLKDPNTNGLEQMLLEPIQELMRPFARARARLSSFFPDKKLIQFDAGKLQTLAELLRELKRGGHRTLIFTQMSKMLDILEAFLNLNGHTYMRLDGSTGVDRRQRLMDRFNNDPRIFCFILSTRSGGTGVNLIGADTVVFYDSDWNPAMDAQAQDRVHRIGQTKDCHVYRLVTEHTIEENILIKAKQKKNLDILVMDKGKFDSSHLFSEEQNARISSDTQTTNVSDVYSKGGLRAILGVVDDEKEPKESKQPTTDDMTTEQMESTMAALEDDDDVKALHGAKKEAAEELKEFDENADANNDDQGDNANGAAGRKGKAKPSDTPKDEDAQRKELEKEFESWQKKVGMDEKAIEASLSPIEKYGFHFRTELDPYYSLYAVLEFKRKAEEEEEQDDEIDIDEIEREKTLEEQQALADGDLLGTNARPSELIRQRNLHQRESSRLKAVKKRRALTGENWETRVDGRSNTDFWYNVDTGEAIWDKPRLLLELEEYQIANEKKWAALPMQPLVHIMSFLVPHPERLMGAASVCRQWRKAAAHPSFVLHVYPVELGAYTRDDRKIEQNHYRTIPAALKAAKPGDTIELGDGHYWINEDVDVRYPLRIIGDENNPSRVVVEMSGSVVNWFAGGGWIEGVSFRRPKLNASGDPMSKSLFQIINGRFDALACCFDNEGSSGKAVAISGVSATGTWKGVTIKGGMSQTNGASVTLMK